MLRRSTIETLLRKAGPIRIKLGGAAGRRRWVELGPPEDIQFVPGQGVRITTTGHVRYAVGEFEPTVEIRKLTFMLEPKLVDGHDGMRLVMCIALEGLDVERIPAFFEGRISALVNAALEPSRERMMWNLGAGLTRDLPLPARISSIDSVGVEPVDAELVISTELLILRVALDPSVTRSDLRVGEVAATVS